ncbi:hypothetical protein AB0O67_17675 [Streptomyces sp. NPDC086077]|uniref:hypothetical protein n=1 Tax=Streptomyces sp. NPDC086077 TaxID=3154862 RepID=UPI0034326594
MEDQLAVLATTAANTVVSSLTTDAWERVRERVVGVWRRHRPAEADEVESATDDAVDVLRGSPGENEESRLVAAWEERFRLLLDAEPAARRALTALVDELSAGQGESAPQRIDMKAEARDSGTVYQAGHTINVHRP